jgi:alpha-L-fucosidase
MNRAMPIVALAGALLMSACAARPRPAAEWAESPAARDARMAWWREARFGLFIHWGLYAIPAGEWNGKRVGGTGEWIQTNAPIPVADYEPLRDRFDPILFDADAWVLAAKRAGMKYVVITTKHHDGFCLFDSVHTDWDVAASPFKRDIMAEIASACRRHGLRVGWYHSIMDWHHPDYLPRRKWDTRPADDADFTRFRAYIAAQCQELLTRYGPVDVMWFDGEWEDTWTHEFGLDLAALCRRLQPRIIINNRVDKGRNDMAGLDREGDWAGDFGTPEQEVPQAGLPGVDWESCMTMNDTWGFRADDHNWKSARTLIRTLADTASKGGNFLLNVGPTADGLIPQASLERLADIGRWMDVNSEAIVGTSASPLGRLPWGRATTRGNDLYLIVFEWPTDGRLVVPGLLNDIREAVVVGHPSGRRLPAVREGDDVAITVPASPLHPDATVIRVRPVGRLSTIKREPPRPASGVSASGVVTLVAPDATLDGPALQFEDKYQALGFWTSRDAWASWTIDAPAGRYSVDVDVSCLPASAGSQAVVLVGATPLTLAVPSTGGWGEFQMVRAGEAQLPGGPVTVKVMPGAEMTNALMNLRRVVLTPVK